MAARADPWAVGVSRVVACSWSRVPVVVMAMCLPHGDVLLVVVVSLRGLGTEAHGFGSDDGAFGGGLVDWHL